MSVCRHVREGRFDMNIPSILLLVVIVCAAIFALAYVAHDGGGEDGEGCDRCDGDCLHCGRSPRNMRDEK